MFHGVLYCFLNVNRGGRLYSTATVPLSLIGGATCTCDISQNQQDLLYLLLYTYRVHCKSLICLNRWPQQTWMDYNSPEMEPSGPDSPTQPLNRESTFSSRLV